MAQYANGITVGVDFSSVIGGTPTYTTIGEVVQGDISGVTTKMLDSTVHGDTYNTFIAGLRDPGDITVKVNFETLNATHQTLLSNQGAGPFAVKFTFPKKNSASTTPMSIASDAILEGPTAIKGPHDGLFEMDTKFKLTGAPVIVNEA